MMRNSSTFMDVLTGRMIISLSLLTVAGYGPLTAQPDRAAQRADRTLFPVSVEVVPFYTGTPPASGVTIHYRVGEDFFVFVWDEGRGVYAADGELLFELLNERNISIARSVRLFQRTRSSATGAGTARDVEGALTLPAPPGRYTLLTSIEDRKSDRSFLNRDISVEVEPLTPDGADLISLFFVSRRPLSDDSSEPVFAPFNRGADVLFGAPPGSGMLLQIAMDSTLDDLAIRWELTNASEITGRPPAQFSGSVYEQYRGTAVIDSASRDLLYRIVPQPGILRTTYVPLPLERLQPGPCTISITLSSGGKQQTHRGEFRVLWYLRPRSLQDVNLAVDALQHIVSEAEMKKLFSVSRNERLRNFADFWRSRDRDTLTAYNEVMAEYYRRVDEAISRYSSANETDGYKTDRGRILILYGSPTSTRRTLEPGAPPRETWLYQHLNLRFVFTDVRKNGMYQLTESGPL